MALAYYTATEVNWYLLAHLFFEVPRPGDSEVTFRLSCLLLLPV